MPVIVDNDANTALLCEARLGAAGDLNHCLMVVLGSGIGCWDPRRR